jgi:uncharacterized protein (TIGR02118 family)
MPFSVIALYPAGEGIWFNMDHYLKTHMPLVEKHWGPAGLLGWELVQVDDKGDDAVQYQIITYLAWKDQKSFEEASKLEATKMIMDDAAKNNSNGTVVMLQGKVVAKMDTKS